MKTGFSTSSDQAKKVWLEIQTREMRKAAYFSKFQGGPEALVFTKEDLSKGKGDKMSFGLTMRLTSSGVNSGQTLENNEEALRNFQSTVTLEEYANAVRSDKFSDQRVAFSIPDESINSLKVWGSEKFDDLCAKALYAGQTKTFFGGTATGVGVGGGLTTGDKLTPALISKVKTWAMTGGGRTYAPLNPINVEGGKYLVLLVPTDVAYDLQQDTNWQQFHRDLDARGDSSPIFQGGLGLINGVVVHSCEFLDQFNMENGGAGANVPYGRCFLMGAGALNVAHGKSPEIVQESFDYGREVGHGLIMYTGVKNPIVDCKSYGSVGVTVARTSISTL